MRPGVVLSVVTVFLLTALAGCVGSPDTPSPPATENQGGAGDAVVIAVVDSGLNAYHFDFRAAMMPQQANDDAADDLPLDSDPASWLPGFPAPSSFASYDRVDLTLTDDEEAVPADLHDTDSAAWQKVQPSTADAVHLRWMPGTKVVGFVSFASTGDGFAANSHGGGSASVSVGNVHGTCPACLLVFVNGPSEVANEWVAKQDWIDAQTNSWGLSLLMRDRMYAGSDTELQRSAIERGQSIFFSAGNGQANTFTVPNPTLWSSQEGPDWIITVGAISPEDGSSYSGHGKPADVASVGGSYPRAGSGINDHGSFGGTSNATPVTTGLYGQALYELRKQMAGASRVQTNGTIATGSADCGAVLAECALQDGTLTVHELRQALFEAALYVGPGWSTQGVVYPATTDEMRFLAQGHGAFWGQLKGPENYRDEVDRIVGVAAGTVTVDVDRAEQGDWMIADSFCRQSLWGPWEHGYYVGDLPASDRVNHPMRTWFIEDCPTLAGAVLEVVRTVT